VITIFLSHQWKSFRRSRSAERNVALQIFIAFIVLYFLAVAIITGFPLHQILSESFPKADPIKIFLGFILYYFSFDFITRFIMQDFPTLAVQPYLMQKGSSIKGLQTSSDTLNDYFKV